MFTFVSPFLYLLFLSSNQFVFGFVERNTPRSDFSTVDDSSGRLDENVHDFINVIKKERLKPIEPMWGENEKFPNTWPSAARVAQMVRCGSDEEWHLIMALVAQREENDDEASQYLSRLAMWKMRELELFFDNVEQRWEEDKSNNDTNIITPLDSEVFGEHDSGSSLREEDTMTLLQRIPDRHMFIKVLQKVQTDLLFSAMDKWYPREEAVGFLHCPSAYLVLVWIIMCHFKDIEEDQVEIIEHQTGFALHLLSGMPAFSTDILESMLWNVTTWDIAVDLKASKCYGSYANYMFQHPVPEARRPAWRDVLGTTT